MKKIKKVIKITSISVIVALLICSSLVFAMHFSQISYAMEFNAPTQIIVYYNKEDDNQVYEPNTAQYQEIYSLINNSYKQSTLKALLNKELNKDIQIEHTKSTQISFDGIKVNFVYNLPQPVRLKSNIYSNNGTTYWYKNLIFTISDVEEFQYNTVAIIPPSKDSNYINKYTYSLNYQAYSNLNKTYNTLIKYFK
jgi:hypothetical protein